MVLCVGYAKNTQRPAGRLAVHDVVVGSDGDDVALYGVNGHQVSHT